MRIIAPRYRFRRFTGSVFSGVPAFLLACAGCAGSESAAGAFPGAEERARGALPIEEVAASDTAADFTDVTALDVDSRGRMYVGDFYQKRVTVLGPDGKFLRTVGRKGAGPGEMQSVRGVQVLPGDSLLVYDPNLARLTVFAPDSGRAAYTVNLAGYVQGEEPFFLRRTGSNQALLAYFRPGFRFGYGDTGERKDGVAVLELDGRARGGRLLSFPSRSFLVASNSIAPNPFGREGLVQPDSRDRLHYVWTDSAVVETYDLAGRRLASFSVPLQAPPVTGEDVGHALEGMSEMGRSMFERTLRDSLPERWPAVAGLLVDDADRIWIGLAGPRDRPPEWAAFSDTGRYLASVFVPAGVEVHAIQGGRLYGVRQEETGVPRLVVLRMERGPES